MSDTNEVTTKAKEPTDPTVAIEERRRVRAESLALEKKAQLAKDLEALDQLEEEHGAERVARLDLDGWRPGWPTFVVVRSPSGSSPNYYKAYSDKVRQAAGNHGKIGAAVDDLGKASVVYPTTSEERAKLFAEYGGVAVSAGRRAVRFVEATEENEKKG